MKKLLVLAMVLGMVASANAGLFISVNGQDAGDMITLMPSDTIILDIFGDGQTLAPVNPWMIVSGPGEATGGEMIYPGSLSSLNRYAVGDGSDILESFIQPGGYAEAQVAYFAILADGAPVQPSTAGTLVNFILFHCTGPVDVTIALANEDLTGVYDTLLIHQIPEPMTLGLLGLGAMFLRRRK
jgi:hypothetical protein